MYMHNTYKLYLTKQIKHDLSSTYEFYYNNEQIFKQKTSYKSAVV